MPKKTISLLFIFVIMMSACASVDTGAVKQENMQTKNLKSFAGEDAYIMYALRAEEIGDSKSAVYLFSILYDKSGKKEYLYKALSNQITLKNYKEVIQKIDEVTLDSTDDLKLTRLKIIALYQLEKYEDAQVLAISLVKKRESISDALLLSDIYIKQKKYTLALQYLESYRRMKGCFEPICKRLLSLYSASNNLEGILSTYLQMYEKNQNETIANKIIQIYGYKKEYSKMIVFLEKYGVDRETLLELYAVTKDYKKAFVLADELYKSSGDIMYLGQSAIFEYESMKKHQDEKVLRSVVKKLEKVVKKDKSPLYENYLGYVLIDHEIDIKKGMQHIRNVLVVQPNSGYYLDSLAWGYYKLHQCAKAQTIMSRVVTLDGGDDPEVLEHVKSINNCMKTKKGKK